MVQVDVDVSTSEAREPALAGPTNPRLDSRTPLPTARPRRLRRTPALRALVRETRLHPSMLVAPLFVLPGRRVRTPIDSMPGVHRMSADVAADEAERLARLGIGGLLLFGLPDAKDAEGSSAWDDDAPVQQALR